MPRGDTYPTFELIYTDIYKSYCTDNIKAIIVTRIYFAWQILVAGPCLLYSQPYTIGTVGSQSSDVWANFIR